MPKSIGAQMAEDLEELENEELEKALRVVGSYIHRMEKLEESKSNELPEPFYETYVLLAARVTGMMEIVQKLSSAQTNFPLAAADMAEQLSFLSNGNYETEGIFKLVDQYQEQLRAYNERRVIKKVDDLFPPSEEQFTEEELAQTE